MRVALHTTGLGDVGCMECANMNRPFREMGPTIVSVHVAGRVLDLCEEHALELHGLLGPVAIKLHEEGRADANPG